MFTIEETKKIIEFNKLEKQYKKLYEEVGYIIKKKYKNFECGDRVGNIVNKEEIPQTAQKNEDGTYSRYHQMGEDYGIVYLPLNDNHKDFVEIYYST